MLENKRNINGLPKRILSISIHGDMLGGGEYSFLDLMKNLPSSWQSIAVLPGEGLLKGLLDSSFIKTFVIQLSTIRPWTLHKVLSSILNLAYLIKRVKPHLIYANGPRAALYSCITKVFHRVPVIWHCRIADRDPCLDWFLSIFSDLIITNSNATANRFRKHFQSKITVIHNGLDITQFKDIAIKKPEAIDEHWKTILVSARVSRQKRHDLALDIFEKVAESQADAHIFFVGGKDPVDHAWWKFIQDKSLNSRYSKRIHWIGHSDDIRSWYKAATILLFPSENEGFGRVIVEAMACGVPVVASYSGGVPEIVRHGKDGFLLKPGDSRGIAKIIIGILSDNSLRQRLSQSAQKRAQNFNLDKHIKKMVEAFHTIL